VFGHVLIDNHHRRGVAGIGLGETPAAQQRDAKYLEIMAGDISVLLVAVVLLALGGRFAGNVERQVDSVADSRSTAVAAASTPGMLSMRRRVSAVKASILPVEE